MIFVLQTIGKGPTRAYHSCTRFDNELLVFGGVFPKPDPQPDGCSDELIIFNMGTWSCFLFLILEICNLLRDRRRKNLYDKQRA